VEEIFNRYMERKGGFDGGRWFPLFLEGSSTFYERYVLFDLI
jgi:hypothetical protein